MSKELTTRDVMINREPAENRFKHVTIQIGWNAKQIVIQLGVDIRLLIAFIFLSYHRVIGT